MFVIKSWFVILHRNASVLDLITTNKILYAEQTFSQPSIPLFSDELLWELLFWISILIYSQLLIYIYLIKAH